ncbi:hypothetical protein [Sporisorium scitamineum]|uniref:Uncharacterized protein n=1 Tax=Sporisorium scitamineum TaxID=49012 RepID=A0A0F7RYL4_9BASI|nr:hypothetical protein [Sporisorium scitamineum]
MATENCHQDWDFKPIGTNGLNQTNLIGMGTVGLHDHVSPNDMGPWHHATI